MGHELAAAGALERGRHRDLDAELVWAVRLALADALDLRRVQGIDLASALASVLRKHAMRQTQFSGEHLSQGLLVGGLAGNVADHPAEIGLQLAQGLGGPLELMGMG